MKGPPRILWRIMLLAIFLFSIIAPVEEAENADPEKVCKEYGLQYPERFKDMCDGDKPKEPENNEKWKVTDTEALSQYIKKGCRGTSYYYWDLQTNNCEKIPDCGTGHYWSLITNTCTEMGSGEGGPP